MAVHARGDFSAQHLVTRIPANEPDQLTWFGDRGFQLCKPGLSLVIGDVPMMPALGYRDAHMRLAAPQVSVHERR